MATSDVDYYNDEEERQFLASLDSPKIEMRSVATGASKSSFKLTASKSPESFQSIEDEVPPHRSSFSLSQMGSRSSLPSSMFDTPMSKATVELDLSEEDGLASPMLRPPSPFKASGLKHLRPRVVETSDDESVRAFSARKASAAVPTKNLIELEDSASANNTASTFELKNYLQKTKTQFERSVSSIRDSSPSGKILASESPDIREMVQPRRIPLSSPITRNVDEASAKSFFSLESEGKTAFPEKKSPHSGTFRAPQKQTDLSIDDSIRNLENQLRNIQSDMTSKRAELERLKKEYLKQKGSSLLKRFFFAILFVLAFMLFDFYLRIIITNKQFDLGNHVKLDEITEFYKNYLDWAYDMYLDLRAKGRTPF